MRSLFRTQAVRHVELAWRAQPQMDLRQRVWAPHSVEGYQMGVIVDVGADTLSVEPLEASGLVSISLLSA